MFPIRDHNPSGRTPFVTYALIVVNVGVFLAYYPQLSEQQLAYFYYDWGLLPQSVMEGQGQITLITHMFLHGGWMHLLGNMLFLYIFADNMEDQLGHARFALFYLLCGFAAAALQIAADPASEVPMVGASGAIAGVMGGYLLLFPKARIDVLLIIVIFFRIFPIPAWIVLGVWFALQVFNGTVTPTDGGGVAYWAHAGGFIAGVILAVRPWLALGGVQFWNRTHGVPPHPEAKYPMQTSSIPKIPRRRV
jgi:membrane associated rhomboid family serine protease